MNSNLLRSSVAMILASCFAGQVAVAAETKYKPVVSSYEKLPAATKGGTLFTDLSGNPKVINPVISADANSTSLEPFIWMPLMTEDLDTLAFLPQLADTYTVSADKKDYTFTLNANAKWQDGTPVTSDDVKFTFDKMMDPKVDAAPARAYWEGVTLTVKDAHTFTFSTKTPKFDTLRTMALFTPICKKQFENEPDYNKAKGIMNPIGNGPYKLTAFQRDQKIELDRVKDWWGSSIPNLKNRWNYDKVVFRLIQDPNLVYERFVKGDLDFMEFVGSGISGVEMYKQKVLGSDKAMFGSTPKDGKNLWSGEFKNKAPRGFSYIGWNEKNPMFQSVKTRTALSHLVDVKDIIEKVLYGYGHQSTSPFGSLTMNSAPELRGAKMISYDLKKALALLKEDGWKDSDGDGILDKTVNGQKMNFAFTLKFNSNNPARGKIAQIVKENFKKAGIDVTIRSMEWNAFLADVDKRDFDAVILGWTATPYPNPAQTWATEAEANQGSNFISYSNKKVDELIKKANVEMDLQKRSKIMQELNRLIYADQPYTFLFEPRSLVAGFSKKMKSATWAMQYNVDPAIDIYSAQ